MPPPLRAAAATAALVAFRTASLTSAPRPTPKPKTPAALPETTIAEKRATPPVGDPFDERLTSTTCERSCEAQLDRASASAAACGASADGRGPRASASLPSMTRENR